MSRLPRFCVDCVHYFSPGVGHAPVCKATYPGAYNLVTGQALAKVEVTCASCRAGDCGPGGAYFEPKAPLPKCLNCGKELAAGKEYCGKDCAIAYLKRTLVVAETGKYGTDFSTLIEARLKELGYYDEEKGMGVK